MAYPDISAWLHKPAATRVNIVTHLLGNGRSIIGPGPTKPI